MLPSEGSLLAISQNRLFQQSASMKWLLRSTLSMIVIKLCLLVSYIFVLRHGYGLRVLDLRSFLGLGHMVGYTTISIHAHFWCVTITISVSFIALPRD